MSEYCAFAMSKVLKVCKVLWCMDHVFIHAKTVRLSYKNGTYWLQHGTVSVLQSCYSLKTYMYCLITGTWATLVCGSVGPFAGITEFIVHKEILCTAD